MERRGTVAPSLSLAERPYPADAARRHPGQPVRPALAVGGTRHKNAAANHGGKTHGRTERRNATGGEGTPGTGGINPAARQASYGSTEGSIPIRQQRSPHAKDHPFPMVQRSGGRGHEFLSIDLQKF